MKIIKKTWKLLCLIGRGIRFFWREYHFIIPISMWKKYYRDTKRKIKKAINGLPVLDPQKKLEYNEWFLKNKAKEKCETNLKYQPFISVIIPVYNAPKSYLEECIDSVLKQTYKNFEICIVDDASTNVETIECLKEYEKNEKCKIRWCDENGHISKASNYAVEIALGEFIALLDNDDVLDENALLENVKLLNTNNNYDLIYSDEDKIDFDGKFCEPHFKPDFSPDTLLSLNYICHFTIIRKEVFDKVGGFKIGTEGAQDYDLFLRVSEITTKIGHIAKILYHWRKSETSTARSLSAKSYVELKTINVLETALKRRGIKGRIIKDKYSDFYRVEYILDKEPSVSIIIPTRDCAKVTEECLKSVFELTEYNNFEILLVDNNSVEKETFEMLNRFKNKYDNFKIIKADMEFNYSKINNFAINKSKSDVIVLLNNDTKVITPKWLKIMVGYAIQNHIGAVGSKLLYEDKTIQHGGVLLGLNAVASHAYINASDDECGVYGRLRVPYNYSAVTAACLAVERSKAIEVGLLDEKLKVAYNDIDFNLKLRNKGYYNVFLPQVSLYHLESKSRGLDTTTDKYEKFKKEENYMLQKYKHIIENDPFYNTNYSKYDPEANFYLNKE